MRAVCDTNVVASALSSPGEIGDHAVRVLPDLRDPDDRIFVEPAVRSRADALITGDADLLVLAGTVAFEVLTPARTLERM